MGNNFGKQIRKKRPAAVRIHIDVWLDQILRFLTRLELYNLQFANRRLNRLIEIGTVKKLLRQKLDFHQLTFAKEKDPDCDLKLVDITNTIDSFSEEVGNDDGGKELLYNGLPLIVGATEETLICIYVQPREYSLAYEIVFPARIETVAQLRLVRFWIHQLTTKICFHYGGNLYHSKTIGLFFNPSMIEVLFPGQGLHFSINKPQLKLRDGMPFPNLASTFKIGRHMDIDYGGCNQLDSLFIFLSETKHFDCADSCMWEAHIDLSRHDNISELNKIYKIYEILKKLDSRQIKALPRFIKFRFMNSVSYDAEDPMANRLGIGRDVSLLNTRDLEDKDFWKNPNWDDSLKIHFFSNLVIDGQQRRLFFFNVKIIDQNDKKPTIKNN